MKRTRGFTLIEVLVVVSIIALLIGILVPSVSAARRQARLVTCGTRLSQIGKALLSYLPENRDRMPWISQAPSFSSAPLDMDKPPVWFPEVLSRQVKERSVFQCQDDKPGLTTRQPPNEGRSYFESERCSYEYRTLLNGLLPGEFGEKVIHRHGGAGVDTTNKNMPANTVWICRDWDNFHSTKFTKNPADDTVRPEGGPGARRYLYIDGHVTDWESR